MKASPLHILTMLLLLSLCSKAQQSDSLSNIRSKIISTNNGPVLLDTNSIVPNSVVIEGVPASNYHVDYVNAWLTWKQPIIAETVRVTYRVFPFKFRLSRERFNYDSIRFNFSPEKPFVYSGIQTDQRIIDFGDINYNGSLGRGISFGNNQDAVLNSTLNLQLSGYIGDSLQLSAAISDNNLPIQPEGNTQRLNEFDKIFMQIGKGGWKANFGDIDIRQDPGYFLRFYKRLQGASFQTVNKIGKHGANSFLASGAIAKGEFVRHQITPIEGNQGPYKLHGANGELYFAVLAGTERIYINGELLQRGADRDYVIDYNTAEITFTAHRLITKDSRIQAEFEYTERSFLNSMLYASDQLSLGDKWKFSVGMYSNTDAKNSPIDQTLTDEQRQFLSTIGNNVGMALYPNAHQDTFSVDKILYNKTDTTFNGNTDTIYVYSTNKNDTLYSVSFTNVGPGNGDYIPANGNANGRVFQWVAPVNGEPQGEWAPVVLLITPKKHQVFSSLIQHKFGESTLLKGELALSNYDVNTFSEMGNNENRGIATKFDLEHEQKIFKKNPQNFKLNAVLSYQYKEKKFRSVETLRDVEFNRDWGLPFQLQPADENIFSASGKVGNQENDFVKYTFTSYTRGDGYKGYRNGIQNQMALKDWHFNLQFNLTNNSSINQSGAFLRQNYEVYKIFPAMGQITIGGKYSSENNQQRYRITDTLTPISFNFQIWEFYIRSNVKKPNKWSLSYTTRKNELPEGDKMKLSDKSRNINLGLELSKNENRRLATNITYRILNVNESLPHRFEDEKTLLSRTSFDFNEWDGVLNGSVLYELGSGREQKREYTFVEVPAGQGYYAWLDYNNDSIPQVNEFEVAVFQDQRKWIKIFTPTNDYIRANYTRFHYSLFVDPKRAYDEAPVGFGKFLSRFSASTALQIEKKEIAQDGILFNPFSKNISDTSLISLHTFLSNSLYFNRSSTVWGIDFTHRLNSTKAILNYGFESNSNRSLNLKGRWNISKSLNFSLENVFKKLELYNPTFANRNYRIRESSLAPSVTYIYKTDFRWGVSYTHDKKRNVLGPKEKAVQNILSTEIRYNIFSSGVINGKFSYNHIDYTGQPNSTVGYIMLNGLQPGKNFLWNVELTKRIAGNIEVNLRYEGRKPGNTKVIHTGQASIRAIF